jgi:outer membrane murein-binding lipoprotein Lpp
MSRNTSRVLIAGAMVLGVVSLGGCATEKYVNTQVGQVATRVDDVSGRVADVSAKVTDHDTKLASLDQTSRDALQRAEAAGKLAEGKFLYHEVPGGQGDPLAGSPGPA